MTTRTPLTDLRERLVEADVTLGKLVAEADNPVERNRRFGKVEGVRLALSYVDEALRAVESAEGATR